MSNKHKIICLDVKYDRMLDACTLDPYDALPQLDRKDPYSRQLYEYIGRKCELLNYDFYDPPREDKEEELMRLKTKSFWMDLFAVFSTARGQKSLKEMGLVVINIS